jgi:PAS domain S-box-containing protein
VPDKLSLDYAALFEDLPQQYIVFGVDDPKFTIIAQNKAHHQNAYYGREVVGLPILEAYPDISESFKKTGRSDIVQSFRTVIRTKKPDVMPLLRYDIPETDGSFRERYWQVTHYPLLDAGKHVIAIYQSTTELTNELAANKQRNLAAMQLEDALMVANIGTWFFDLLSNTVTADRFLASMFGVAPKVAAKGMPLEVFTNAIYQQDRAHVLAAIKKTIMSKGRFDEEYRTISTDGTIRWVTARGRIETNQAGEAISFPGVVIDITESKQSALNALFFARVSRRLASSLNHKKTLLSIADLAIPDIADWCAIELVNEAGTAELAALKHKDPKQEAIFKKYIEKQHAFAGNTNAALRVIESGSAEFYPEIPNELLEKQITSPADLKMLKAIGLSSLILVPLSQQDKTIGCVTFALAGQQRHYSEADFNFAKELASRASLAISNALLYETVTSELHRREQLQTALSQANEQLEARVAERTEALEMTNQNLQRSNQELQDFAYVASHDLQEPLRKIQAFGNLLDDEFGDNIGEGRDYLKRMRSAAARMSVLIEDLLSFSRVTTHAKDFAQVDLEETLAAVLEDLENRILTTAGSVTSTPLPTIQAESTQMRQLFQNLIGNALKFHDPEHGSHVKVQASTVKGKLKLQFKDDGVGFDEKYLDRIFAVFQRLHGREAYEGTGIGLAVCRKIVERHNGTITAKSEPGKGATFTVILPIKQL